MQPGEVHRALLAEAEHTEDLAVAGFPDRAASNAALALDGLDDRTPTCRAMLTLLNIQALVASEEGNHAPALELARTAQESASRAAPSARAWTMLGEARLLASLGDLAAARRLTDEAVGQTPARARVVKFEGHLQRGRLAGAAGDRVATLESIHAARLVSVERRSMLGILLSELALLEGMEESLDAKDEVIPVGELR